MTTWPELEANHACAQPDASGLKTHVQETYVDAPRYSKFVKEKLINKFRAQATAERNRIYN